MCSFEQVFEVSHGIRTQAHWREGIKNVTIYDYIYIYMKGRDHFDNGYLDNFDNDYNCYKLFDSPSKIVKL
jgi:hypothetical protein